MSLASCCKTIFEVREVFMFNSEIFQMIQPFILRRSKRDVEKQLTKKYEHVLKCRLSSRQKAMYEDVILQPG